MRSAWDCEGRAGDNAEYLVKLRLVEVGLTVCVSHYWSGVVLGSGLVPRDLWDSMCYEQQKGVVMSFFRKPPVADKSKDGGADPSDDKMKKNYPTLWEYLSSSTWPDGESRKRSSLVVFCEDSAVKGCLSDKELEVCLWAASPTFLGLLEALEGRLQEDRPDWRASKKKK